MNAKTFATIVGACLLILSALWAPSFCIHDFTIYWKATTAFVAGRNPYDLPHYSSYLEHCLPVDESSRNMVAWGPPWVFGLLAPIGFLSLISAKQLFVVGLLSTLWMVSYILCKAYRMPAVSLPGFLLLFFTMAPLGIWCMAFQWGSPTWYMLLGLASFLYLSDRRHDFLSGLALTTCLLKLHIIVPFLVAISIRSAIEKRYRIIAGGGAGSCSVLLSTLIFNPSSFPNFWEMFRSGSLDGLTSASLPSVIESMYPFAGKTCLVGCTLCGLILALSMARHRSFLVLAAVLVPISVTLSPFAWGHDYIICLPSCLFMAKAAAGTSNPRRREALILFGGCILNMAMLALSVKFFVPGWWYLFYGVGLSALSLGLILADRGAGANSTALANESEICRRLPL